MYIASFLAVAVAAHAMALPTESVEHAALVSRQASAPDGSGIPGNFTIPTPGPVAPGGCFIGKVSAAANPLLIGRYVHGPQAGLSQLFPDPRLGSPLMIDPNNRLRLAWFPLSVGWRQKLLPFPDGWLAFRDQGPLLQFDNLLTCDGSSGVLLCQAEPGDQMLSQGDELWVGQAHNPALQNLLPITITTYPIPCLPPANGLQF